MQIVRCVAKTAFQGNAAASQLSFQKGETITYDTSHPQSQGWVWGTVVRTSQSGWCPLSYLAPHAPVAPAPVCMAPPNPCRNPQVVSNSNSDDSGFSGSIQGGTAAGQTTGEQTLPASSTTGGTAGSVDDNLQPPRSVKNTFSNIGATVQRAGRNSWIAVSAGAQKAGNYTQKAFVETKCRVEDTMLQTMNKPEGKRTDGEQRAIDVGNYAARGAVVGSVTNAVFNPSLRNIARGATRGAVSGGTYGFVRKWKPFG